MQQLYPFGYIQVEYLIGTFVLLYFYFPVLYKITKRWPVTIYLTSNFITLAVLKYAKLEWYQDCFISRIPIFLFGILYFHINKCQNSLYKALLISLFFWNIAIEYSNSKFFITSSFCPILIFVLSYILGKRMVVTKKINNYISYMGTHSYELFLSNGFTQFTLIEINNIYNITLPIIILIYISSTIFYGFAFIKIQKLINKCINIW